MKAVVVSDLHFDHVTLGVPRYEELKNAVNQAVEAAIRERADTFLFLGDLCDPDSGSSVFRSVALAIETALRLHAEGIDSHWLAGNHDVIEDGSDETTLTPLRALERLDHVFVHEQPGSLKRRGINFLVLPFTATSHTYNPVEEFRKHYRHDSFNVVMGHLSIPGVQPGEETTEMPRGRDVVFPVEEIGASNMLCFNGHYHRRQVYKGITIPGSLCRLTFGEETHEPGYLVAEV